MPTTELAGVSRAAPNPMVLRNPLTLRAMDAFGVEVADEPFKTRGVVREVAVKLVEGVAALAGGASLGTVAVAFVHVLRVTETSTCVKGIITILYIYPAIGGQLTRTH